MCVRTCRFMCVCVSFLLMQGFSSSLLGVPLTDTKYQAQIIKKKKARYLTINFRINIIPSGVKNQTFTSSYSGQSSYMLRCVRQLPSKNMFPNSSHEVLVLSRAYHVIYKHAHATQWRYIMQDSLYR